MKLSKSTLLIAAAILCCVAVAVPAQSPEAAKSSSVTLGDKVIVIPNPEGFEEAISQFESTKRFFDAMASKDGDMLLAHLPTSDCELLRNNSRPAMNIWTTVFVSKGNRESTRTNADLARYVTGFRKNGAAWLDPDGPAVKSAMEKAEQVFSAEKSKQIEFEAVETQQLGEFDVRPEVYSIMIFSLHKMIVEGTPSMRPTLASLTWLKVGSRIINVAVYRKIRLQGDMKDELKPAVVEVQQFTTKWVNAILAANPEKQ